MVALLEFVAGMARRGFELLDHLLDDFRVERRASMKRDDDALLAFTVNLVAAFASYHLETGLQQ